MQNIRSKRCRSAPKFKNEKCKSYFKFQLSICSLKICHKDNQACKSVRKETIIKLTRLHLFCRTKPASSISFKALRKKKHTKTEKNKRKIIQKERRKERRDELLWCVCNV